MQISSYRDEDAKCLVVQMLSNGHVMMQMLMYVCHDVNAPLWVCRDANVHVMQTQFIQKNSFYFQNEASTTPETKIFSNSIYCS